MTIGSEGIALITGASAGIGACYADRLAQRGFDLILVARRVDRLAAISSRISGEYGVQVEVRQADLTTDAGIQSVVETLQNHDNIQMLVNNAGVARLANFSDQPLEEIEAMTRLNVIALTRLTHAILPRFKARNHGAIINVASVLAFHSLPISAVYSGTKAYVLNFSRGILGELAETDVRLQLVMPATTATELWDLSGVPLSALDPATVMSSGAMVDAALAAFDAGEVFTLPSVEDRQLWSGFETARNATFAATQTGATASRYLNGQHRPRQDDTGVRPAD